MPNHALLALAKWLSATALSHTIQTVTWIIPTLQTIHILCLAVLFSSAILVNLRALGILLRDTRVQDVAARFLPAILPLVGVLLVTGSLLIIGEPRRSLLNDTFYIKLGLIVVALLLTAALRRAFAGGDTQPGGVRQRAAQVVAAASILAWSGVLIAGRWIAYTQVE